MKVCFVLFNFFAQRFNHRLLFLTVKALTIFFTPCWLSWNKPCYLRCVFYKIFALQFPESMFFLYFLIEKYKGLSIFFAAIPPLIMNRLAKGHFLKVCFL